VTRKAVGVFVAVRHFMEIVRGLVAAGLLC
jgi:hypothetical protein